MKASRFFYKTLREVSAEADTISHQLLLRAGFIQQVAAGIFNYLPLGWRSIQKIRQIMVEEMDAAGGQQINMPVVQPLDLWRESGRATSFVPPLPTFTDRHNRPMTLAPTHEETATMMARSVIFSYRDMPRITYHIQTKYRDEPRPRAGLLRVREFEMKDAYSFDTDEAGLDESFELMAATYHKIFKRCGTPAIMAEADSGPIGGKSSREFVLLASSGDDVLLRCDSCSYAANVERADFNKEQLPLEAILPMEEFDTPGTKTISELADAENVPPSRTAKTVFFVAEQGIVIAVIRGDYEVNQIKLRNQIGAEVRKARQDEVAAAGFVAGFASPVGQEGRNGIYKTVVDDSLQMGSNFIAGANAPDKHLRNVNFPRDFTADICGDIAVAANGYECINCRGTLQAERGIEVGHIFKLGDRYSRSMHFTFADVNGVEKYPLMGSYGIGLGRLLAAAIEANNDVTGMMLPKSIAPFAVCVIAIGNDTSTEYKVATELYKQLLDLGVETLFDDRNAPPGVKFADADLIGFPVRVVVSPRSMKSNGVEIKTRHSADASIHSVKTAVQTIPELLDTLP